MPSRHPVPPVPAKDEPDTITPEDQATAIANRTKIERHHRHGNDYPRTVPPYAVRKQLREATLAVGRQKGVTRG